MYLNDIETISTSTEPQSKRPFLGENRLSQYLYYQRVTLQTFAGQELFLSKTEGRGRSPQESRGTGRALVKNAFSATKGPKRPKSNFNLAYSALASFRMGMPGSAWGRLCESRKLQIKRVNFLRAHVAQYQRSVVRC
jgi:hypothetical protein